MLVNNAGIKGPTALVDDIDYADWRECLEVGLDSHFLCARRAAPVMKAAGARAPSSTSPRWPACTASAGARPMRRRNGRSIGFTKSLAVELGPHNVRCNCICPGAVSRRAHRPGHRRRSGTAAACPPRRSRREMISGQSIRRFVEPGRDRRSVPVPGLARRQDDHRPGHRPRRPHRNLSHGIVSARMDFALSEEQRMIVKTTRDFVENELFPHEAEVERTGELAEELRQKLKAKALEAGLYAANMPAETGGGRSRYGDLGALRARARPGQLCPALELRRAGPPTSSWPASASSARSISIPRSGARRPTVSP